MFYYNASISFHQTAKIRLMVKELAMYNFYQCFHDRYLGKLYNKFFLNFPWNVSKIVATQLFLRKLKKCQMSANNLGTSWYIWIDVVQKIAAKYCLYDSSAIATCCIKIAKFYLRWFKDLNPPKTEVKWQIQWHSFI